MILSPTTKWKAEKKWRGATSCCDSSEDLNIIIISQKNLTYCTAERIATVKQKEAKMLQESIFFLSSKGFNGQQAQIYLHKYLLLRFWHPIPSLKNCLPLLICCSFPVVGCSRHLGVSTSQPVGVGFCYKEFSPRDADEERFKSRAFLDARTFLRVIMSFCLSPSTSANWRLSWEYRSCISFSSVSTAPYLPLSSNMSFISSLISLKLCNTASSSPCCLKKELDDRSLVSC